MDTDELYSNAYIAEILKEVRNPNDLLLRFRELTVPIGYVTADDLKSKICKYIDDSGFTHF